MQRKLIFAKRHTESKLKCSQNETKFYFECEKNGGKIQSNTIFLKDQNLSHFVLYFNFEITNDRKFLQKCEMCRNLKEMGAKP